MVLLRWGGESDREIALDLALAATYNQDPEYLAGVRTTVGNELNLDPRVLLAEEGGVAVGMGRWVPAKVSRDDATLVPGMAHINMINVDPGRRRRGIARMIVCALLADAEDAGRPRARLYVDASNVGAIDLYVSQGFALSAAESDTFVTPDGERIVAMYREPRG